jgi:hypothetical protein
MHRLSLDVCHSDSGRGWAPRSWALDNHRWWACMWSHWVGVLCASDWPIGDLRAGLGGCLRDDINDLRGGGAVAFILLRTGHVGTTRRLANAAIKHSASRVSMCTSMRIIARTSPPDGSATRAPSGSSGTNAVEEHTSRTHHSPQRNDPISWIFLE